MRKEITFVFLLVVFFVSMMPNLTLVASANGTEIAVINPETGDSDFIFYTNTTAVGTHFNATVWAHDVTNLFAYQVYLCVDDSLLNVTNAWFPTWDPNWVFNGKTTIRPAPAFYDFNVNGKIECVKIGDTIFGGDPFTGTGLLATIEFEIISAPIEGNVSCNLDIDNADTYLLDYDLDEISTTKTNGYYEYVGPTPPPIPTAIVYVEPPKTVDPALIPCNNFEANVTIANATDVYSFEFKLSYDPTILNIVNATLGDFFPPTVVPQVTINNTAGYLNFSAALSPPDLPVSGNGSLATITFHVEGLGGSDLILYDVGVYDESSDPLPFTTENGFFANVLLAKIYIEPAELIDPGLIPSAIFTVDVVIDDVENLYAYEFKLGYNTYMLTCIGILIHPILNETNFSTEMVVDDAMGFIWANITYRPPATPITTYTPKSIVTLTFMVDNVGSSPLDLYDTNLTDPTQNPIPHEAIDGFVMTLIRDVAVTNVTVSEAWVYATFPVNITVTVSNQGNITETFDVKAYYDSNLIDTQTVTDLDPNEEKSLIFIWDTSGVEEGNYTIKAEAMPVPDEFDLADNIYEDGSIEIKKLRRDVAIINISADPSIIYAGWLVNVTVTARNEGNLSETFDVIVYYCNYTMVSYAVIDLDPDEEITFNYVWDTTGLPECSNFTISAEATTVPNEVDTGDNYMIDGWVKIKLMGDINGDDKVDIKDVATVSTAFGSYPGHERWNPEADLNRDDQVDIRDIAMVASNFGKTC